MSNYLVSHYRGVYKILPEINRATNDFVREEDGTISENDFYIPCKKGSRIYYYGHYDDNKTRVWLTAYIPSVKIGSSCMRELQQNGAEIRSFRVLDGEILFNFKASDIQKVAGVMKPSVRGAKTSPRSKKNLPASDYQIPSDQMEAYRRITEGMGIKDHLLVNHATERFLKNVLQRTIRKTDKSFDYMADATKKCMSRQMKEYIHSMGVWDKYIQYLSKEFKR